MQVVIPVDEGPLWRVTSIQFDGADSLSSEEVGGAASLEEGQPFSLPEVREAQVKLKSFYRERGFPNVKVRVKLDEAPGGMAITFQIEEGDLAEVGGVRIVGTKRIQESLIRRQLTFKEGDAVRVSELQASQRNLYDTRLFSSVAVRVDAGQEGKEQKDILVQVAERTDLDVSYGLRYNVVSEQDTTSLDTQQDGLEGTLRANLFSPFGQGGALGLSAFFQSQRTLFRATERFPHFFKFRIPTALIAEVEREDREIGYETRVWSLAFQQIRAWKQPETGRDRFAVQWNIKGGRIRVRGDQDLEGNPFDRREWRTLVGASLIGDNRNSLSNPTRGRFWNLTVQAAPKFLGSDTQYLRFFGQLFYHQPIFKGLGWASSYRLGLADGSEEFLFIEDRFRAGGANSVRGFKQDSLGPSITIPESNEELFIGGQAVVVMNQELRFPTYKMLHGGVFYDTGNVFARVKDLQLSELRHSAGWGLRLVLPFGALRLDWARILDLEEGETPSRWHFSFGYAF
jgi:outer membrane protein assembly complex protein YaeT